MRAYNCVAACVALLLVTACAGDNGDDVDAGAQAEVVGAPPTTPICETVLPEELLAYTGRTFKPGVTKTAAGEMYRCEWEPESDEAGVVTVTLYPNADKAFTQYEGLPGMEEVTGIGDAAWWSSPVQTFVMRLGTRLLVVGFGSQDGSHQAQAELIIRRAMGRV